MKRKIAAIVLLLVVIGLFVKFKLLNNGNGYFSSGIIEMDTADMAFRVNGFVDRINVDEGQIVNGGQKLMVLDQERYKLIVESSSATLKSLEAKLAEAINGTRLEDIEKAELEVVKAKANLQKLKSDLDRATELFSGRSISQKDLDQVKNLYSVSEAIYKQTKLNLELARKGVRKETINSLKAQVKKAETSLKQAKLELSYTNLLSPFDGIVNRIYIDTGETASQGRPVVSIVRPESAYIRTYIPGTMLGKVNIGTKMKVTTEAINGKTFTADVFYISSEAEFTPKQVHTRDERAKFMYMIKLKIENMPEDVFKQGMPVDVSMEEN